MSQLTPIDEAILSLEHSAPSPTARMRAADAAGLSWVEWTRRLNVLLDDPDALAHSPVEVNRLRRLRTARARSRSARRLPR